VKKARTAKDLIGIRLLTAELKTEWLKNKRPEYLPVIVDLGLAINSMASTRVDLHTSMHDLAVSVIDWPGEKPPEITMKLLLLLQNDPEYSSGMLKGDEWVKERQIRAERWLNVWKRIREQLAALPAPSEPFYFQVDPPAETHLPTGVAPSAIKDPVLRKQYELAIEKNTRIANAFQKKQYLTDQEKLFAGSAKRYLVEAFCKPPFRTDDLDTVLEKYGLDQKIRQTMVDEVRRRSEERITRDAKIAKAITASIAPKAPERFAVPAPGAYVDAKFLSTDPKLLTPISIKLTRPKLGDLLDLLSSKTGYEITAGGDITRDRLAYWSIHHHNVPAWLVMDQVNEAVTEKGRWVKKEKGYQMVGESKPPLKVLANVEDQAPESSDQLWILVAVMAIPGAVYVIWFAFHRWRRRSQDSGKGA